MVNDNFLIIKIALKFLLTKINTPLTIALSMTIIMNKRTHPYFGVPFKIFYKQIEI